MSAHISNVRPRPDDVLVKIADYAAKYAVRSKEALETARYCLMDTLGCGFEALEYPACTKLLGPIVKGTVVAQYISQAHVAKALSELQSMCAFYKVIGSYPVSAAG